jgi:membrane protease YdiL (CAAX protease family)
VKFPNGVQAALLMMALFVLEFLLTLLLRPIVGPDIEARTIAALAVPVISSALLLGGVLRYTGLPVSLLIHPAQHSVRATFAVLAIPILMIVPGLVLVLSMINSIVLSLFPISPTLRAAFDQVMAGGSVTMLFICLIGPAFEELLFRGVILRGLLEHYSRGVAFVASAALFGIAHMNLYQFVAAGLLGLILGWLYERSRSLWPCILLHAGYNTANAFGYAALRASQHSSNNLTLTWGLFLAIVTLAAIGATLLQKFLSPRR